MESITFQEKQYSSNKKYTYPIFVRLIVIFSCLLFYNFSFISFNFNQSSFLFTLYIIFAICINTVLLFLFCLFITLIIHRFLPSHLAKIIYYISIFVGIFWLMIAHTLFSIFQVQVHVFALPFIWNWQKLANLNLSSSFWRYYALFVVITLLILYIVGSLDTVRRKKIPMFFRHTSAASILFYCLSFILLFIIHLSLFEWLLINKNPDIISAKMRVPFLITSPIHFSCSNNSCTNQGALYNYFPYRKAKELQASAGVAINTKKLPNIILFLRNNLKNQVAARFMPLVTQLTEEWQHLPHHYTSSYKPEQALNDLIFGVPFTAETSLLPIKEWLEQNNYEFHIISALPLNKQLPISKYTYALSTRSNSQANKRLSNKIFYLIKKRNTKKPLFLVAYYNQPELKTGMAQSLLQLDRQWGKLLVLLEKKNYLEHSFIGLSSAIKEKNASELTDLQVPFIFNCSFCSSGYLATKPITSHWQFLPSLLTLLNGPKLPSTNTSWISGSNDNFAYTSNKLLWFTKSYTLSLNPLALWNPISFIKEKQNPNQEKKYLLKRALQQFYMWKHDFLFQKNG